MGLITEHVFALGGQPYGVDAAAGGSTGRASSWGCTGHGGEARPADRHRWRPYHPSMRMDVRGLWIRPAHGAPEGSALDRRGLPRPGLLERHEPADLPDLAIAATRSHGVYEAGEAITIVLQSFGFAAGWAAPVSLEVRDGFEQLLRSIDVEVPGYPLAGVRRVLALPVEGRASSDHGAMDRAGVACRRDLGVAARSHAAGLGLRHQPWLGQRRPVSWPGAGACWVRWLGLWDASSRSRGGRCDPSELRRALREAGFRTLACVPSLGSLGVRGERTTWH